MTALLSEEQKRKARRRLLSFGADAARWPVEDHKLWRAASADAACEADFAHARALDLALTRAQAPAALEALKDGILRLFPTTAPRRPFWPARRSVVRLAAGGALAAALALGFATGVATARSGSDYEASPSPFLAADESSDFWGDGA